MMENAFGCFEGQEETMREKIFRNQMSRIILTLCSHQSG